MIVEKKDGEFTIIQCQNCGFPRHKGYGLKFNSNKDMVYLCNSCFLDAALKISQHLTEAIEAEKAGGEDE